MRVWESARIRRYETADGLARDIQRYLADEPVEACPPPATYRFRKFARRNRVALWTAVLVSASLVLGTAISAWQAVRATRAQHLADAARTAEALERGEVEQQRQQAQRNFEQARRTVDQYFTLVSESKLLDVPGLQPLRADLLEAALRFYREFDKSRSNDPAVLADLAATYLRVAVVYHGSDRNDDAVAALQKGLAIVEQLRHDHPGAAEQHRKLAGFWKGWRRAQAETQLPRDPRAAFQVLQKLTEQWEQFARENPSIPGFQSDLAATYYLIADLLITSGQRDEGLAFLEKSRAGLDQLVGGNPQVPEFRADLARTCEDIAWRLIDPAGSKRADVLSRQALALREQLVKDFPDVPQYQSDLAETLKSFGDRAVRIRNLQEARTTYIRAVELSQNLADQFPLVPLYSETLVVTQHQLMKVRESTEQLSDQEAERDRRQEIEAVAKLVSHFPTNSIFPFHLAQCHRELAMILAANGRCDDAIAAHTRATQLLEKLANDHPNRAYFRSVLARSQLDFGELLVDRGQRKDGEGFCRQALDSYTKLVQEYPASAVYARDLEECRRRLAAALQEH